MTQEVKVGVGAIIWRDGKVLLGKRKGSHGAGYYAPPGGRLHYMESFEDCVKREVLEETGIVVTGQLTMAGFSNNLFKEEDHHYVSVLMHAEHNTGEPQLLEPDKCEGWDWYDPMELPQPLFEPFKKATAHWK